MDVLVVVGRERAPTHLEDRARLVHRFVEGDSLDALIGVLRARIPRRVGVCGPIDEAARVAAAIQHAGLPTELFSDDALPKEYARALSGVDVRRISDPGPPIDAVNSLVDLIGNTPMVRLDRTARDVECTLLGKLELFNPGGSSKDRIAVGDDRSCRT